MHHLAVFVNEGLPFHGNYRYKIMQILTFDWPYFTQCLTSFSSIDHLLCLCAWFLILFRLT